MSTAVRSGAVRALLADGRVVVVNVITPADADAVLALQARLSEHDRYCGLSALGPGCWTRSPAGSPARRTNQHAAIGAYLGDQLVGVAHFEVLLGTTTAEVALDRRAELAGDNAESRHGEA